MPGTLDRRQFRDSSTPLDSVDRRRSYDEQATTCDQSDVCPSTTSRSSDDVETDPATVDESLCSASNLVSEVDCVGESHESTEVVTTEEVDADVPKVALSTSEVDENRDPSRSCAAVARPRRWRSDEGKTRKELSDVTGVRRRRCRSLERRQSWTDAKHLLPRGDAAGCGERSGELGLVGTTVRKSDSFDSGIDTKSESTSRGGTDDVLDAASVNSRPDVVATRRGVIPEVLSLTPAEVEYDRVAATLVRCLGDRDADLRGVLPSLAFRVPICYVCGIFDNVVRPLSSNRAADADDDCSEDSVIAADELKVGSAAVSRIELVLTHNFVTVVRHIFLFVLLKNSY